MRKKSKIQQQQKSGAVQVGRSEPCLLSKPLKQLSKSIKKTKFIRKIKSIKQTEKNTKKFGFYSREGI